MLKQTPNGTRYLTAPEAIIVAATRWEGADITLQSEFIEPLFPVSDAPDYFEDDPLVSDEGGDGAQLAKFAGQLCYLSFGPQRSKNAQASEYLRHIKESSHGSVLEHVSYSILLWGVSRAFTHELVRHRAGFGFSQVSQRYVAGKHLRFVETPATFFEENAVEYDVRTPEGQYVARQRMARADLHYGFERWIDACAAEYSRRERQLLTARRIDQAKATTDQRKAVRQEARRCLPNETEAPVLVTGNLRAWRHMIEQRANRFADAEICRASMLCFEKLREHEPMLWEDYAVETVREDGFPTVSTPYRKV